jgi:PEP-CTERM motif
MVFVLNQATHNLLATAATKLSIYLLPGCLDISHSPGLRFPENSTSLSKLEFVFGGCIVLRKGPLPLLVLALFFSTLASANSATVNMKFLHPGTNIAGGYYTYPYYFSINGGKATPMMCDAFNNHNSLGESWHASVSGLLSGKGLFGKDMMDYKAAGIIFLGVVSGTIDAKVGNWAVWNLFTHNVTTNSAVLALDHSALTQAASAPASEFKGLALFTPVGGSPGHGPQEFIGFRSSVMSAPEPGSMMLISTGLLGIAGLLRRKVLANRI